MAQPTNVGHVKRKAGALKGVSPKGGGKAEPPQKKEVSAGSNLVQAFKNPDEMQDSALKNIMGAFRTTFGKKGDLEARKREGVRSKLAQRANPVTSPLEEKVSRRTAKWMTEGLR